jgi:hypothetical protein
MTQAEFNELPLLLRRHDVCELLGWPAELVHDYRRDGDLRVFQPNPEVARAYYYRADVAKIHGQLALDVSFIDELPEFIRAGQFMHYSGLSPRSFYTACNCGQLVDLRHDGHYRRFYAKDLEWFT